MPDETQDGLEAQVKARIAAIKIRERRIHEWRTRRWLRDRTARTAAAAEPTNGALQSALRQRAYDSLRVRRDLLTYALYDHPDLALTAVRVVGHDPRFLAEVAFEAMNASDPDQRAAIETARVRSEQRLASVVPALEGAFPLAVARETGFVVVVRLVRSHELPVRRGDVELENPYHGDGVVYRGV